jgi:hypothetical protein
VRGSVQGDLRAALRANLFAQMATPSAGNQNSEINKRADFWVRFESQYLNRQQLCLSCHNTEFSVTGPPSDWPRHRPIAHMAEKVTFGCSNGLCVEPPDLQSDFRVTGVVGGSEHPWGLAAECGGFNSAPSPQTTCPPLPAGPANPATDNLEDVCFKDASGVRRSPEARFGGDAAVGSVFRLDQLLVTGASSLATMGLVDDMSVLHEVTADGATVPGARGMAIMTAANVAERVWEEVYGSRLTLALHYPRADATRDRLFQLSMALLKPASGQPWSLRYLLKQIALAPEFNAATGGSDEFGMDILFNQWVLEDPRPAQEETQRCTATNPTFEGCVRGLMQKHACVNCHENPDVSAPRFSHSNYADFVARAVTQAQCESTKTSCGAPGSLDCADLAGKPGGTIALRVSCTNGLRMPKGYPPLPEADRLAIVTWVSQGGLQGTRQADTVPADVAAATHNGVGDSVRWKSPFQLTYAMGTALFRPSAGGAQTTDVWANPLPGAGYPNRTVAEVAGHYLDDTLTGGRGLSLLGLLAWERAHEDSSGAFCSFGAGADAIDALVTTGATAESIVRALKQRFMGEQGLTDAERPLLEDVLGSPLSEVVSDANTAALNAGARNLCNVFMKSPLFLLSYVEPPPGAMMRRLSQAANAPPPSGHPSPAPDPAPLILPEICEGRLDCRQDLAQLAGTLAECSAGPHECRGNDGRAVTDTVESALINLRLPVDKPALDLATALVEMPAAVPSINDPRLASNVLVLPFAGGVVRELKGDIDAFFDGKLRKLKHGDTPRFGEVLFVPEHARLAVQVGPDLYDTGRGGMEEPPAGVCRDDDHDHGHGHAHGHDCGHDHLNGHQTPHGRGHDSDQHQGWHWGWAHASGHDHDHSHPHCSKPEWVILCNGPQGQSQPTPALDPRIPVGTPLGTVPELPLVGSRPAWAQYGEGGLWYFRP